MGYNVGDLIGAYWSALDLAKFELGFLWFNFLEDESSLDVVKDSEVFFGFFNSDDIHETGGVTVVFSGLVVNLLLKFYLNVTFLIVEDKFNFPAVHGVFQSILENDREWEGFSEFMGTLGRSSGPFST